MRVLRLLWLFLKSGRWQVCQVYGHKWGWWMKLRRMGPQIRRVCSRCHQVEFSTIQINWAKLRKIAAESEALRKKKEEKNECPS